jgi:hypothetical protein
MMKKTLIIVALLFAGYQAHSQVLISIIFGDKLNSPNLEFGLEGGYNWSKISGFETGKPLGTFNLGFYFDFRIKKDFYIYTGVLVKSNTGIDNLRNDDLRKIGATIYDTSSINLEGNYKQKLSYFWVPVLAKYRHKSNIFIEAGPQVGLMYKARIEFDSQVDDKDALLIEINKDAINRIDVGALVGAGYKFKNGPGWSVSVKYYYGFVDVYKNVSNTKNTSLFLTVNIPIGANKKKDSEKSE